MSLGTLNDVLATVGRYGKLNAPVHTWQVSNTGITKLEFHAAGIGSGQMNTASSFLSHFS